MGIEVLCLKGETRMFVHNNIKEKVAIIAVIAVLLFAGCASLFSDSSFAEGEEQTATVEKIDPVTITVHDAEKTVDVFEYLGVKYAVTSTKFAQEKVGVYGVDEKFEGDYIVVCSFDYDDKTYRVTSVLAEFQNSDLTGHKLVLADTITVLGVDCFKDINVSGTIVVSDDVDDTMIDNAGYEDIMKIGETTHKRCVTLKYDKGEITYPQSQYQDQSMEDQDIHFGITSQAHECGFENPYYDFDSWESSELTIRDMASITCFNDKIYIDGVEKFPVDDDHTFEFTAIWTESDYSEDHKNFGDYPVYYMYVTSAVIVLLFVLGFVMLGLRIRTARRA